MAPPDETVRITLDLLDPPAVGEPLILTTGQEFQGTVTFQAMEDVAFREVQVRLFWHTEGKGNRVSGTGGSFSFAHEGEWKEGANPRFPFRLRAPGGPISYSGKILRILWALEVRLDRSMLKSDIRISRPVELLAGPDPQDVNLGPRAQKKEKLEARKRGRRGLWLTLSVVGFLGAVLFGAATNWDIQGNDRWFLFLLILGAFLLMLRGLWGRLGQGKLGEPTIQLSTTEVRRGEEIRFHVSIHPAERTELRTLEAILECEERVIHGHGQYQSRHRRTVYERRLLLAEHQVIESHRGMRRKGVLTVPAEAPPTFGAPDNEVIWWLRFQGDIVGWPDWNEPVLLTVRP